MYIKPIQLNILLAVINMFYTFSSINNLTIEWMDKMTCIRIQLQSFVLSIRFYSNISLFWFFTNKINVQRIISNNIKTSVSLLIKIIFSHECPSLILRVCGEVKLSIVIVQKEKSLHGIRKQMNKHIPEK